MLLCLACVGGCSDYHNSGPEAWWHAAIGGKIAEQRPPPPGDKDPYPNLATVPPKPPAPNTAQWSQMTAGLMTDRLKAAQAAAIAPIPPATAGTSAALPGEGPVPGQSGMQGPQPRASTASASLVGESPPVPAPPTPPLSPAAPGPAASATSPSTNTAKPATPGATQMATGPAVAAAPVPPPPTGPFTQPSTTSSPPGGVVVAPGSAQATPPAVPASQAVPVTSASAAERVANGQLPPLPTQEPTRPDIAPGPPPPAVPVTSTSPLVAPTAVGTGVDFDQGSAALNDAALADIKALAAVRGDRGVAVTGYGDATASDPLAQSDALTLGLSRAQALATALVAQGVPFARVRLNAESAGRGASLRLLQ